MAGDEEKGLPGEADFLAHVDSLYDKGGEQQNTDENQNNSLGEHQEQNKPVVDGNQEQAPEIELTDKESKAWDMGWRPEDQFTGKEGNWKPADEYIYDQKWIDKFKELNKKTDDLETDFNTRLENNNKLHEVRRQKEINALLKTQREAVEDADLEKFDETQKEIDELKKEPVEATPPVDDNTQGKHPDIVAWETKNPWVFDQTNEKAQVAVSAYNSFLTAHPQATYKEVLDHVDTRLATIYPDKDEQTNPRRNQVNTVEKPGRVTQRKGRKLTWNDLSTEQRDEWSTFGESIFKTKEVFLQSIQDMEK